MHVTLLVALISTLGLSQAQLPNLPDCSLNCFLPALQNDGCPILTNFTCHCAVPSLVSAITPCVQGACNLPDQSSVSDAVTSVCSSVSVPISIPPVTATSSTSSTAAAAGSGSASTTLSKTPCSSISTSSTASSGTGTESAASGSTSSSSAVTSGVSATESTSASESSSVPAETSTSTSTHTTTGTTTTGVPRATGAADSVSSPLFGTGLMAIGIMALFVL